MPRATQKKQKPGSDRAPLEWGALVGYKDAQRVFAALAQADRLPGSVLIEGPEASGKRSFLGYIASLFWCESQDGCGVCSPCKQIMNHSHEDVLWIEAAPDQNQYKLEDVELLQQHLLLEPQGGGSSRRIVCLVDCDRLNVQSGNRLLKVLEEPPEKALILTSSSRPFRLLETIRSRLFRYRVRPPDRAEAVAFLKERVPDAEMSDKAISSVLAVTGFAVGEALRRLQGASEFQDDYEDLARAFFTEPQETLEIVEAAVKQKKVAANELAMRFEVILNQYYKMCLGLSRDVEGFALPDGARQPPSWQDCARRREVLRKAKKLVIAADVPLNAQLLAEAVTL